MSTEDDMTALALDYLQRGGVPTHIREAFAAIPPAPLATLAEKFIAAQPRIDLAPLVRRIIEINQGRLEDLDAPEFVSYLIAETNSDETTMKRVIIALGKFDAYLQSAPKDTQRLAIAARDTEGPGQTTTTVAELLRLRKKRVK
ncbi:MAG: hypothetical protein WAN59_11410 [Candidatus Baltobacteraceae bacterium]